MGLIKLIYFREVILLFFFHFFVKLQVKLFLLIQIVFLLPRMFLLQTFNVVLQLFILRNKCCLVRIVFLSVFIKSNWSRSNVHLQLPPCTLWLPHHLFDTWQVLSNIIDHLQQFYDWIVTFDFSSNAITVVFKCSISTSFSLSPLPQSSLPKEASYYCSPIL